jgi:hypothetical protein
MPAQKVYYKEVNLGQWCSMQRVSLKKGKLEQGRQKMLESIPGWLWDPHLSLWTTTCELLVEFVQTHDKMPVQSTFYKDVRLGDWCNTQRINRKKGKMASSRQKQLESIPGWFWG